MLWKKRDDGLDLKTFAERLKTVGDNLDTISEWVKKHDAIHDRLFSEVIKNAATDMKRTAKDFREFSAEIMRSEARKWLAHQVFRAALTLLGGCIIAKIGFSNLSIGGFDFDLWSLFK